MKLLITNRTVSTWAMRGWLAAKLSGLPFSTDIIAMDSEDWAKRRAAGDIPSGKLPMLIDGPDRIWDSMAILLWLADKGGHDRFWPREPHARALCYGMSAEMHAGHQALRSGCMMNLKMRFPDYQASEAVLADVTRIDGLWCEARSRFGEELDEPYLFGHFSAADVMFAPVVYRFHHYGLPRSEKAEAYIQAMLAHPWLQEWWNAAQAETFTMTRYSYEGGVPV